DHTGDFPAGRLVKAALGSKQLDRPARLGKRSRVGCNLQPKRRRSRLFSRGNHSISGLAAHKARIVGRPGAWRGSFLLREPFVPLVERGLALDFIGVVVIALALARPLVYRLNRKEEDRRIIR